MGDLDSANTGSMQSSSTGGGVDDQEYDSSRNNGVSSDSIVSAFLNPISTLNNMSSSSSPHPPPPPPPLQLYSFNNTNNNGSSSFDAHNHNHNHLSNFFDLHPPTLPHSSLPSSSNFMLSHNNHNHAHNNSIINQLHMVWPNKFRPLSSTDDADADAAVTTNNYTINNNHQQQHQQQPPPPPPPPPPQPQPQPQPVTSSSGRNPKKRTRASRRAPTTVLTTDTNNFRQMVQEFTGVPAPPFTAFSTRARFDLFNGLGLGQVQGQGHSTCAPSSLPTTTTPPPYLLRPFPQKIPPLQQPPFLANINNNNPSTTNNNNTYSSAINLCDQDFINTNPNLTTLLTTTSSVSPLAPANYRGITANTALPPAGDVNVNVNGAADNIIRGTSSSKGEGMVDSWICSSSD